MKFSLFLLFVGCLSLNSYSQSSETDSVWHVRYHKNNMTVEAYFENKSAEEIHKMNRFPFVYHFYCNSRLGYYYLEGQEGNRLRRKKVIGKKIFHHSNYIDFLSRKIWYGINYHYTGTRKLYGLMLHTDSSSYVWEKTNLQKEILGYTCNLAIAYTAQKDSVLAWYIPGVANGMSMHPYEDLPGLALEIIHQRGDMHLYAIDLKREQKQLVLPENPRIIQREELNEAIRKHNDFMDIRPGTIRIQ
jgi:GLPGLI family protein